MRTTTLFLISIALLTACGGGEPIDDNVVTEKRLLRDSLKEERAQINERIAEVENWLAKNDPELKRILPTVTTYQLEPQHFAHYTEVHGTVKADENALIHTSTGGVIRRILVRPGQQVRRGDMIVDIDTDALQQNIQQAKANVDLARTVYERQNRLWEQQIGSEVQLLEAKSRKEAGEAQLSALQEQLRNAQVIAPFDGVVDEIFPSVGDMASPLQPVARVVKLGKASIEVDLAEDMLGKVKIGDPVEVVLPESRDTIAATIDQIGQFINPNNRTFKVSLRMEGGAELRPNQLANVRIRDMEARDALVVPARLVMENSEGRSYVFVLEKHEGADRVRKQYVKVLSAQGGEMLLERDPNALKGGDVLIDQGSRLVVDKQEVNVRKDA